MRVIANRPCLARPGYRIGGPMIAILEAARF